MKQEGNVREGDRDEYKEGIRMNVGGCWLNEGMDLDE